MSNGEKRWEGWEPWSPFRMSSEIPGMDSQNMWAWWQPSPVFPSQMGTWGPERERHFSDITQQQTGITFQVFWFPVWCCFNSSRLLWVNLNFLLENRRKHVRMTFNKRGKKYYVSPHLTWNANYSPIFLVLSHAEARQPELYHSRAWLIDQLEVLFEHWALKTHLGLIWEHTP